MLHVKVKTYVFEEESIYLGGSVKVSSVSKDLRNKVAERLRVELLVCIHSLTSRVRFPVFPAKLGLYG